MHACIYHEPQVVHSRDNEGVGVAQEIISPKNQPQFSDEDGAVLVK